MRFGDLKIGRRMGLVVAVSVIGTLLVGAVDAWRTRAMLLEDRQVKTQHVVEIAHGIIASYHKQAAVTGEQEAQQAALAELAALRYGGEEYFWVNDMVPQSVAAATEELSTSIREISQQVANSASIANHAVLEAKRTDTTVTALSEASQRIGADEPRGRQLPGAGTCRLMSVASTAVTARRDPTASNPSLMTR
ncbi:cache domain-containing protein [Dongia deserti]|uniref:cache domain-containing protein n=1 Tax=Dongia deserti TaxID=2268030 RepID=UPI000E65C077|nr:cache domain-containing protein [Dongia deserti]